MSPNFPKKVATSVLTLQSYVFNKTDKKLLDIWVTFDGKYLSPKPLKIRLIWSHWVDFPAAKSIHIKLEIRILNYHTLGNKLKRTFFKKRFAGPEINVINLNFLKAIWKIYYSFAYKKQPLNWPF